MLRSPQTCGASNSLPSASVSVEWRLPPTARRVLRGVLCGVVIPTFSERVCDDFYRCEFLFACDVFGRCFLTCNVWVQHVDAVPVYENCSIPSTVTSLSFNTSEPETTRTAAPRQLPQNHVSRELGRARVTTHDFVSTRIHERSQCACSLHSFALANVSAATLLQGLCSGPECVGEAQKPRSVVPVDWIPLRTVASSKITVVADAAFFLKDFCCGWPTNISYVQCGVPDICR